MLAATQGQQVLTHLKLEFLPPHWYLHTVIELCQSPRHKPYPGVCRAWMPRPLAPQSLVSRPIVRGNPVTSLLFVFQVFWRRRRTCHIMLKLKNFRRKMKFSDVFWCKNAHQAYRVWSGPVYWNFFSFWKAATVRNIRNSLLLICLLTSARPRYDYKLKLNSSSLKM